MHRGWACEGRELFRGYVVENPLHLSGNIITVLFTRVGEIYVNVNVSRKLFKRQCYAMLGVYATLCKKTQVVIALSLVFSCLVQK
jgi:hypothetical protein